MLFNVGYVLHRPVRYLVGKEEKKNKKTTLIINN
jgi:hypothetical protein